MGTTGALGPFRIFLQTVSGQLWQRFGATGESGLDDD